MHVLGAAIGRGIGIAILRYAGAVWFGIAGCAPASEKLVLMALLAAGH